MGPGDNARTSRRANPSHLKDSCDRSTEPTLADIIVPNGGEIVVAVRVYVRSESHEGFVRPGFTAADLGDLRCLIATADRDEVRTAASAVLAFATGKSYTDCAAGTPYGEGWTRALVAAYRQGGTQAILTRAYRRPRSKSGGGDARQPA